MVPTDVVPLPPVTPPDHDTILTARSFPGSNTANGGTKHSAEGGTCWPQRREKTETPRGRGGPDSKAIGRKVAMCSLRLGLALSPPLGSPFAPIPPQLPKSHRGTSCADRCL